MSELPSGTVTFLFTDVEGSTRLLREHGDGYVALLAEQRRAIRAALNAHGGVEVGTEGDAVFAVFASARNAVTAARDAQAALRSGPVRVRMGLHTGTPLLTDEGYVGIDVHRAARIAAAGHGGSSSKRWRGRSTHGARSKSTSAPGGCCSSSTTSSRCSTRRRTSPCCSPPAPGSTCW